MLSLAVGLFLGTQTALAIDVDFDQIDNLLTEFSLSTTALTLADVGVGGTQGVQFASLPDGSYRSDRLTYRHEEFDTGIVCCAGDPVVPLSVFFQYEEPDPSQINNNTLYSFAELFVSTGLSGGSRLSATLKASRSGVNEPLDFRLGVEASTQQRSGLIAPLSDGHWYRMTALLGRNGSDTFAAMRLDDLGLEGTSAPVEHAKATQSLFRYSFPVDESFAGFFGGTVGGGGAVAFDEFHSVFGDFNLDGRVNAADYTLYRDAFGTRDRMANPSGNHIVDTEDYAIWRDAYGESAFAELEPESNAVPEPAGLTLALGGLAAAFSSLRRQNA